MSGLAPTRRPGIVFFALCFALLACSAAFAQGTNCSVQNAACHILGNCNTDTGLCECQPGTVDKSTGGASGQNCDKNAWTIRYVVDAGDPGENPTATLTSAEGMAKCAGNAEGFFVRSVGGMEEVNCLYRYDASAKPDETELAKYNTTSPEGAVYLVAPSVYTWVLPTTSAPLQIPPTGMTVDSVHFESACAKSGCWVIKGSLATGEAFNTFGAFNTFFLPQTQLAWTDHCDMVFERDGETICWTMSDPDATADWDAANTSCTAKDGHLAQILSRTEGEAFTRMLQREDRSSESLWIGLNDKDEEGTFTWPAAAVHYLPTGWDFDRNRENRDCFIGRTNVDNQFIADTCAQSKSYVCETTEPAEPVQPPSSLSYDFDYSSTGPINVDWTFLPVNHPCTSAAYEAGSGDGTGKISTCCITNPRVGTAGGFVANYRPTQQFVEWSGDLTCDYFVNRDDQTICIKYNAIRSPFEKAQERCEVAGGKLHTIQNENEAAAFMDFAYSGGAYGGSSPKVGLLGVVTVQPWIGFADLDDDGTYEWLDGWNGTYTNWNKNSQNRGNCVFLRKDTGLWTETACTTSLHYLCEFDAPLFDHTCVEHVIQRPENTKPEPDTPCWNKVEEKKTFNAAEADCVSQGGHLVSVDDAEENWFLTRMKQYFGLGSEIWLGLTKRVNNTAEYPGWTDGMELEFENWGNSQPKECTNCICASVNDNGVWVSRRCDRLAFVCEIPRNDTAPMECDSDVLANLDKEFDVTFPSRRTSFVYEGQFKGMPDSPGVTKLTEVDAFFGAYKYEIKLDEVELRSKAGILTGTVGVEHTVDTFLGMANFRPTGLHVLDTFATQVAIHLEKTSFFSVSTHGVNQYTFLEYVNMRLVTVYNQDTDFSGSGSSTGAGAGGSNDNESADRSVRTNSSANVNYVQVTFTMGSQYAPNPDSGGLIPLDSVRAGKGTFFENADTGTPAADGDLTHVCDGYTTATTLGVYGYEVAKSTFTAQVAQECGPKSTMCASPSSVPDQFVSFNIPLGTEVFEDPSDDLSKNIFVDMVINAIDTKASGKPNNGDDPQQMKTTLTASIPIVRGGINIFCDGITAKTDLKDVANADVIVGSAANSTELTRLRILEDIASTQLAEDDLANNIIDSDSIEAGLLTIVIKGNASYFASGNTGSNTLGYTMELDDVISIHIMEDGEAPTATQDDGTKMGTVMELLATPADDNSDSNGLDTDGYKLNGAFYFSVVRNAAAGESRALLEPTDELKAVCPFNPPRPSPGSSPLETCITRRDVRSRGYPKRNGADEDTAMEIAAFDRAQAASPSVMNTAAVDTYLNGISPSDATLPRESEFMVSILGDNDYAKQLAIDYAKAIHERYTLNGRYVRAYWINPGYEWTPTQTAGKSLFSISQKIYLFMLISLDENWPVRRRMLLQTATGDEKLQESGAGVGKTEVAFNVNPTSLLAQAFEVPLEKVAKFAVEMQLTKSEACMSPNDRQAAMMETFDDYLTDTASAYHTVQVTSIEVDMNGETCDRRRRQLKADFSSATAAVNMVIVFEEATASKFNLAKFSTMPGISAVTPAASNTATEYPEDYVAPTEKENTSDSDSDSSNVALIAGVAGGIGGALLVAGVGVVLFQRSKRSPPDVVTAVHAINVNDLKQQLSDEC